MSAPLNTTSSLNMGNFISSCNTSIKETRTNLGDAQARVLLNIRSAGLIQSVAGARRLSTTDLKAPTHEQLMLAKDLTAIDQYLATAQKAYDELCKSFAKLEPACPKADKSILVFYKREITDLRADIARTREEVVRIQGLFNKAIQSNVQITGFRQFNPSLAADPKAAAQQQIGKIDAFIAAQDTSISPETAEELFLLRDGLKAALSESKNVKDSATPSKPSQQPPIATPRPVTPVVFDLRGSMPPLKRLRDRCENVYVRAEEIPGNLESWMGMVMPDFSCQPRDLQDKICRKIGSAVAKQTNRPLLSDGEKIKLGLDNLLTDPIRFVEVVCEVVPEVNVGIRPLRFIRSLQDIVKAGDNGFDRQVLHNLFNSHVSREFKITVYRELGMRWGLKGKQAEDRGRADFSKLVYFKQDLEAIISVCEKSHEFMNGAHCVA